MRRLRKKTALPKAKAKVKAKAKAASQRQRRERLRAGRLLRSVANKRLTARRDALRKLNKLLTDLSLQALHLRVKALDKSNMSASVDKQAGQQASMHASKQARC